MFLTDLNLFLNYLFHYIDLIILYNDITDIKLGSIEVLYGTVNTGFTYAYKIGKLVICNVYIDNITTTATWAAIAKLPYTPKSQFTTICGGRTWIIDTNSNISQRDILTNVTLAINFAYFTNN